MHPRAITIATPAYSGSLTVEYVGALLANIADLSKHGIVVDLKILPGLCYIDMARNELVSMFLKTDSTDLVFWDDDVSAPADGVFRLLQHDLDVVAGVYPMKTEEEKYPVRLLDGAKIKPITRLIECEGLPTGFMRIKRHVIEMMIEAMPERKYKNPVNGDEHHDLFSVERINGVKWGEDYRFCQLAREHGFRMWADTTLELRHVGRWVWNGKFGNQFSAG